MPRPRPHLLLRAPMPSQSTLSFCDATPRDLKRWIAALPKANIGEMARQLYQGMAELNQLVTPSENRLPLLELLRPEVYYVCKHLERHFLNQAIILDERARKVANLCQALQNQLAIGYKQIIVDIVPKLGKDRLPILAAAIQRALHCLNGPLVRASLLYCPVPEGLWLELHQLYQIAREHKVQGTLVTDELALATRSMTPEQSYACALLLGSSRCNQMRQSAISKLAEALEAWSALVKIQPAKAPSSLFVIVPGSDSPPRYKTLFTDEQVVNLPGLGLDPQPLAKAIKVYLELPIEQRSQSKLPMPNGISSDLLQLVAAAWGDVAERTFQRTLGQGTLTLCVGMSSLHYHLGGQRSFSDILRRPAGFAAEFGAVSTPSNWSHAFDTDKMSTGFEEIQYSQPGAARESINSASTTEDYPTYVLQIVNHSPGGYCLAWLKDVPSQLQAGEMVGIQDSPSQGWSVAVVRWVRQVRSGGTQMGIELVAPNAQPCGLQLMRSNEPNSQYLRGLLLPEIRAIDIPATLLAPRLPFQEGNKVVINTNGDESRAGLGKRVASTGSFNQFEYRAIEPPVDPGNTPVAASIGAQEDDFDSLWKDL